MTYIGSHPAASFAKATSQTFTGDNSDVTFTLNKRVSNPEDLEVFVSNVQQQPTTSYTIDSDGVTLRFSEAPPSGQFYVVYRNLAQQTGIDTGASRLVGNNTFTGTQTVTANPAIVVNNDTLARVQLANSTVGTGSSDGVQFQISGANGYVGSYDGTMNIFGGSSGTTATGITVNSTGFVTKPQTPMCSVTKNINSQVQTISGSNYYTLTGMTSAYGNSYSVNNKSYWNTNNSRFEIPTGTPTAFYHCEFNTLLGIARPSSGVNWGFIGIRKNNSSGLSNNISAQAYREATNGMGTSTYVYDMLSCACIYSLAADEWVEPIFSGSDGVAMVIHAGNYTNFTVMQVG